MNELTTLQKALFKIKKLKQALLNQSKPIAMVGLSCRFPEANNKDEYWRILLQGKNVISTIPEERWKLLENSQEISLRDSDEKYWGSYLNRIADFDAYFFGISPREAIRMDPQQRILLEVAYEAFEDAGLPLDKIAGSNMGVFLGMFTSQYWHLQKLENELDALYIPTGNAMSIAANRLSYLFDLHGPSITVDTACSASLVATQLACLNLQNNLCDTALVCGANINLLPSITATLSKAKMLSPDGQCNTFDARANGYVRGEGVGVVVLKLLERAIQDNDRIYAVIAGSAINQDGATNGLTAPNGLQQEALLKTACQAAQVNPNHISFMECHGTGTFLGDPIEIEALGNVISSHRTADNTCWIGSVKTNLGHLEPAAGVASLIKTALALHHAKIPPNLNFVTPNPYINFQKYQFKIPDKVEEWPKYGDCRIAGVNGFGFGGTNVNIILRELRDSEKVSLEIKESNIDQPSTQKAELFTLSAKDAVALKELVKKWCEFLAGNTDICMSQLCYNLHVKRSHHAVRLAIIINTTFDLYHSLCQLKKNFDETSEFIFTNGREGSLATAKEVANESSIEVKPGIDLRQLAALYIQLKPINWVRYESDRSYPYMDIPLYSWQHKHYWSKMAHEPTTLKTVHTNTDYPLLGKVIFSPLKQNQYEFELCTQQLPEMRDTHFVVHAGFYLEMIAFALKNSYEKTAFTLRKLNFSSVLMVPDRLPINVQLIIEAIDETYLFKFYSKTEGNKNWVEHASGQVFIDDSIHQPVELVAIQERCTQHHNAEDFNQRLIAMGLPIGNSVSWTKQYWLGVNEVLCELSTPTLQNTAEKFVINIHPGVVDNCLRAQFMLLPQEYDKPFLASQLGKMRYFGIRGNQLYLWASIKTIDFSTGNLISEWCLMNSIGEVLIDCEDAAMTQIERRIDLEKIMQTNGLQDVDFSLLSPQECQYEVMNYLLEQIANIFSMPKDDINVQESLQKMGMDSLMAMVLVRAIEGGLGVNYSLEELIKEPPIKNIVDDIIQRLPHNQQTQNFVPCNEVPTLIVEELPKQDNSRWIMHRQKISVSKMRLFCFPFGGGGASIYREWQSLCPNFIEVCPIQLPGRETRLKEKSIAEINILIESLFESISTEFDLPFAFFGHSFGSLIAFELTRYLRRKSLKLPIHLFMSAYPDPKLPARSLNNLLLQLGEISTKLFDLNDEAAVAKLTDAELDHLLTIFSENGVVEYNHLKMDKDFMRMLLPIFVSDMNIVKSYCYEEELPLEIPITAFCGRQDSWVSYEDHLGWRAHTQQAFKIHQFNSGHLFIKELAFRKQIVEEIVRCSRKAIFNTQMIET